MRKGGELATWWRRTANSRRVKHPPREPAPMLSSLDVLPARPPTPPVPDHLPSALIWRAGFSNPRSFSKLSPCGRIRPCSRTGRGRLTGANHGAATPSRNNHFAAQTSRGRDRLLPFHDIPSDRAGTMATARQPGGKSRRLASRRSVGNQRCAHCREDGRGNSSVGLATGNCAKSPGSRRRQQSAGLISVLAPTQPAPSQDPPQLHRRRSRQPVRRPSEHGT